MYAATAFIIMEAAEIMLPRLGLPDWTVTFLIILLIVGFPITIILSWIFDITPEGVRKTESIRTSPEEEIIPSPVKRRLKPSDVIISLLLAAVMILLYPKIFKTDKFKDIRDLDGRISVAVMPFQNMTNDTSWNIWQLGIQNELITHLSNSTELAVRQLQTLSDILQGSDEINTAAFTPSVASDISRKAQANSFILGSIKASGSTVRINAQLIDTESNEIYKTFQIDGEVAEDFFAVTDSLSRLIRNFLEIKMLEKEVDRDYISLGTTHSTEALRYYIKGLNYFISSEYPDAVIHLNNALEIDSSFAMARTMLVFAYNHQSMFKEAKQTLQRAYMDIDQLSYFNQVVLEYLKSFYEKDPATCIKYLHQLIEFEPQSRVIQFEMGLEHYLIHQYEKAVGYFEEAFEIDRQWGGGFKFSPFYYFTGSAYHELGNHKREKEILELGLKVASNKQEIIHRLAVCALSRDNTDEADHYITMYRDLMTTEGENEDWIEFYVGLIYKDAGKTEKAIDILADQVERNPGNDRFRYHLALTLIENEIEVDNVMVHIEKALISDPDHWDYLTAKGMGLYKQGLLVEARETLQKAWELRAIYDHDHYLLLREVNQALAKQ
jgi:tetratricopeptide (TPR) repeat protein